MTYEERIAAERRGKGLLAAGIGGSFLAGIPYSALMRSIEADPSFAFWSYWPVITMGAAVGVLWRTYLADKFMEWRFVRAGRAAKRR